MNNDSEMSKLRYGFVTSQIQFHDGRISDAFEKWVTLSTAIVGAYFWLTFQNNAGASLLNGARAVFCTVGLCYGLFILFNLRAWWGFRKQETELMGKDAGGKDRVPPPRFPTSAWSEVVMFLAILLFTGGGLVASFWI